LLDLAVETLVFAPAVSDEYGRPRNDQVTHAKQQVHCTPGTQGSAGEYNVEQRIDHAEALADTRELCTFD
jgi:hypothetical protein